MGESRRAWPLRIGRALVVCLGLSVAPAVVAGGDAARGNGKASKCSECHELRSKAAQAPVPVLAGQQREFLTLQMFYLREGLRDVPDMAGLFKGFSDQDLEDIAAYYSAQPPPKQLTTADGSLHDRGAALSRALGCGSCHLADFRGQKHVPRIASQREDYLVSALKAYRDNKRTGTDTSMNGVMYSVSDADIAALAHYLAHYY